MPMDGQRRAVSSQVSVCGGLGLGLFVFQVGIPYSNTLLRRLPSQVFLQVPLDQPCVFALNFIELWF